MNSDIVHISPTMFGGGGIWGGGERYAFELARAQSLLAPTRLVVFGDRTQRLRLEQLSIHVLRARTKWRRNVLNPLSELLALEIAQASVVHSHQLETALTDVGAITARCMGRKVFVTDHGGAAPALLSARHRNSLVDGHLAVSKFAASFYPALMDRTTVVYGGVNPERFSIGPGKRENTVVYVGRLLPHKGVDVLIAALPAGVRLELYGRPYDKTYAADLERMARNKDVYFESFASDSDIIQAYRRARVAVLPSVHRTLYGEVAPKTELFGLTLVEAMACGTPVICTSAGAMHEVVVDGHTGYVVPSGDPIALRDRLQLLLRDSAQWHSMSAAAADHVQTHFTWRHVAERSLAAYSQVTDRSRPYSRVSTVYSESRFASSSRARDA